MSGRTEHPPIKEWRAEHTKLTAAKCTACERYYALQDEVRSIEQFAEGRGEYHATGSEGNAHAQVARSRIVIHLYDYEVW